MEDAHNHHFFMNEALLMAQEALKQEEVPVGAVIIDEHNNIIGRGKNMIEHDRCQSSHAEVLAIKEACAARGDWRLDGCSIYVTLEPCLMCFGLIGLSRIKKIFFGGTSPLFGCGLDNKDTFPVYKKDLFVQGGIKEEECVELLRRFFKEKRSLDKGRV